MTTGTAGRGLYILINANAKRGGRRVAAQIARALPGANVRLTRSIAEVDSYLRSVLYPSAAFVQPAPVRCVLSAGGDGSAITLLNALDRVVPKGEPFPPVGALPLGTGNAWAHALGARKLDFCVKALARHGGPLPTRHYALLECDGVLTFFGGCGWDAELLDDFQAQVKSSPSSRLAKSVWGYLSAMITRTVPKSIVNGRAEARIVNLGDDVLTLDPTGKLVKMEGVGRGALLYEGPASMAGAATCPEFGYGFRAYPFAERLLDRMNIRVYDRPATHALLKIPQLWRGQHPMPGAHDWFVTSVRMTFNRPVPLQIGGEAIGVRDTVDYRHSARSVDALDWRML